MLRSAARGGVVRRSVANSKLKQSFDALSANGWVARAGDQELWRMATEGAALDRMSKWIPGLDGKRALEGRATVYVCERGRCELPTSDPDVFAGLLLTASTGV